MFITDFRSILFVFTNIKSCFTDTYTGRSAPSCCFIGHKYISIHLKPKYNYLTIALSETLSPKLSTSSI